MLSSEVFRVVYITNKKIVSINASYGQCFSLGICFYSYFNSLSSGSPSMFKEPLYRVYSGRFLSYSKKGKISQNSHPLSIPWRSLCVVVPLRWRSFSLVVPLVAACCTARCDSLSLVVVARCHSLSLDVLSVCGRSSNRSMSGFLLKYPNFFSFKLFNYLWDNSCTHFLLIIL